MLTDHLTCEPLTHTHHPLQVVNGNATAGRTRIPPWQTLWARRFPTLPPRAGA